MKIIVVERMGKTILDYLNSRSCWVFPTFVTRTTDISKLGPYTLLLNVPAKKVGEIMRQYPEDAFFMIIPSGGRSSESVDKLIDGLERGDYRDLYPNLDSYYILDGGAEEALNAAKACTDTYLAHRNLCAVIEKINEIRPDTFTRTPGGEYIIFRHGTSELQPVVEDPVPLELFASAILHSEEDLARLMSVWLTCSDYFRGGM